MTTTTQPASKPPFIQARELYGELFEAENLATAMWHFSEMKPAEQRFIQAHLLFLLLHGQAVANLNLKDIRQQLDGFDDRLEDTEAEEEAADQSELDATGSGAAGRGGERGDDNEADEQDEDEEDEEEEEERVDVAERAEQRAVKNAGDDVPLSPQLQAAVGVLEEALTVGNAPGAP